MADLAQRLDTPGRRVVVLAGPGDRRNEDILAIADAVAGRFDHYVCRRDDALRGRASDEVPLMLAARLREKGVPDGAIVIIPDEQEAIEHALKSGAPGDLLLIFADALVRSWKQVIYFRPEGVAAPVHASAAASMTAMHEPGPVEEASLARMDGLVRDERGVRFSRDAED